ncbi:serine hydrolase domain-containing protein [Brevundimonas sp. UBA2416]|uniref:serine hydrolase domain-containing protein n=1 Tax=Brevundimonas sp. UBA2416 TaxID=1946124 RepID=UPI0025BD68C7|nr:serine hydrolase domain-containing protein [Brevundimonas sp. UBA2416]HRJ65274.1 serine hydrolase domain-containing protein [Brevundimonas sp.]
MRFAHWSASVFALALMAGASSCLARPASEPDRDAGRRSDLILASLVESNGVPGMAGSVWQDGRIVWTGAAGYADVEAGRRVDGDTIFRLASVSKLFAVMAAGRLREQGRLDPDAPVRTLLPWLPDRWPDISARQLAAHTSGVPHYQTVDADRGSVRYASVRDAVALFQDRELLAPPGQAYVYSSWGYVLLSAQVEAAAGASYLDYLKAEITPGLEIVPDATDGDNPYASRAYAFTDSRARPAPSHDFSYTWGGGGLGGTAPALATWGGRVLEGQVVARDTFEWMQQPMPLNGGGVAADDTYQVGFGWRAERDAHGRRLAHHAGVTVGARSSLVLYPDHATATTVLSNALWVSSIDVTAQMLAAPFLPVERDGPVIDCPVGAAPYTGTWGEAAIAGEARFEVRDGLCLGDLAIAPGNAFGDMLNGQPQGDSATLKVIGVEAGEGLGRAALVTPIGVYDLRGQGDGRWWSPLGGGARSLSIRID